MKRAFARTSLALAVTALLAVTPPAGAAPVLVRGALTAVRVDGAVRVCAWGEVDDGITVAGTWTFAVASSDSGTVVEPVVLISGTAFAPVCEHIVVTTPTGVATATLDYAGVGVPDVAGLWGVVVQWSPPTGVKITSFGL